MIVKTVFLIILFIQLLFLKVILVIKFTFSDINMSWAPPRASFHLRLTAPAKNDSESGPKHIYVSEHKIYCFIG